jgi:hypothetical protein
MLKGCSGTVETVLHSEHGGPVHQRAMRCAGAAKAHAATGWVLKAAQAPP